MEKILLDVFPCNVIVAPETYTTKLDVRSDIPNTLYRDVTRIIITETRVMVAIDSPEGAQVIGNELYDPETLELGKKPDYLTRLTTISGKKIAFLKDDGCGCGSRLRSWNPYRSLLSTKG